MKKLFFIACLTFLFSCSKDNEPQADVTANDRPSRTTWKLISIKNHAGDEIANTCELHNGKIIVTYNPEGDVFDQDMAVVIEGNENAGCQMVVKNNLHWYLFGDKLDMIYGNTTYFYDYKVDVENSVSYMSLTLTGSNNSAALPVEERRTCKYQQESFEYLD
jgi:hypothetical protein